jgi:nitrogen regulatory protein PII
MKPVKRIEIIVAASGLNDILAALRDAGAAKFSVIHDVSGSGIHGYIQDDDMTGTYQRKLFVAAVAPDVADQIARLAAPALKRYGGVCIITDALVLDGTA